MKEIEEKIDRGNKVRRCPRCRGRLDSLFKRMRYNAVTSSEMRLVNGAIEYDSPDMDEIEKIKTEEWRCGECNYVIAKTESDAVKFLKLPVTSQN